VSTFHNLATTEKQVCISNKHPTLLIEKHITVQNM